MSWGKVKVGDCCEVTSSKRIFFSEYVDSGVPFYRSKEIIESSNGQAISEPLFISQEKYDEIKNHFGVPQPGDMLLTSVGTIGVPYIVREKDYFYFKDGNLTWFRNFSDELNSKYLYFWVKSSEGQSVLNNTTIGSSQKALTIASLKGLEIPCPPAPVQKRIVEILAGYDDLIENNQKQIKLLEEAAQRLYKEWFVDLRFPGHETTPIVDGVPEGWTYKPFSEVFDYVRGKSYTSKELSDTTGILMANLKNIRAFGGYNRNAEKRFTGQYKANQMLYAGDIVMGVTDMTQERRLVGHVALVPDLGEKMTFSMDLIKIIPKLTDNLFLYSAMYYGGLSKQISPLANGVNVLHLKPEAMMGIEMLIPAKDILERYHQQFAPMVTRIEALQKQCDVAAEARDRLIPKLMNREIEV